MTPRPFLLLVLLSSLACDSSSEAPSDEIPCGEVRGARADFSLANSEVEGAQVGQPSACEAGVDIPVTRSAGSNSMADVVNDRAVNVRAALAGAGAEVYGYGSGRCSSQIAVIIDDWAKRTTRCEDSPVS